MKRYIKSNNSASHENIRKQLSDVGYTKEEIKQIMYRVQSGWTLDAAMQEADAQYEKNNTSNSNIDDESKKYEKLTTAEMQNEDGTWTQVADKIDIQHYYHNPEHPQWYRKPYDEDDEYFYEDAFGILYRFKKI